MHVLLTCLLILSSPVWGDDNHAHAPASELIVSTNSRGILVNRNMGRAFAVVRESTLEHFAHGEEGECHLDPNDAIWTDFRNILGTCDQQAQAMSYQEESSGRHGRMLRSAVDVCQCYANERNLYGTAYDSIERATSDRENTVGIQSLLNQLRNGEITKNSNIPGPDDINKNIRTEEFLLRDLRNGILFQSSLLATNNEEMNQFTSGFAQTYIKDPVTTSRIAQLDQQIARRFTGSSVAREVLTAP
jgi:hypothetical protein